MKINPEKTIPTKQSSDANWIEWHKSLRQNFGRKSANQIWAYAWDKRKTIAANTSDLRSYMEKQGVSIDGGLGLLSDAADFTSGVGDYFENVFQMSKYAGYAIGVIVIGGLGMVVYNLAKDPAKSIATIALKK